MDSDSPVPPRIQRELTPEEELAQREAEAAKESESRYLDAQLDVLRAIKRKGVYWPGE